MKIIIIGFMVCLLFVPNIFAYNKKYTWNDIEQLTNKVMNFIDNRNINLEYFIKKVDFFIFKNEWIKKDILIRLNNNLKEKICLNYYNIHNNVSASVFWVWEWADASNAYISNDMSAWDEEWFKHFKENKENNFYFALPYNDFDSNWRKTNAINVPWYKIKKWRNNESIVKNRWIKIRYKNKTAFWQWEDVWPLLEDDFNYVFWDDESKNKFWLKAWIDLSPDFADYLWINWEGVVEWNFIPEYCVAEWPWKNIITISWTNWK